MAKKRNAAKRAAPRAAKKQTLGEKAGQALGIAGAIMLIFGLAMFLMPGITIDTAVVFLGFVLVVSGMFKLFEGLFIIRGAEYSGYLAAGGAIALAIGLLILGAPQFVVSGVFFVFGALAFLIALVALFSGVAQLVYAFKKSEGRGMHLLLGAVLAVLGIGILYNPWASAVGMVMVMGIFAMIDGIILLVLASKMKEILD